MVVLNGDALWHLQRFLQCIKYNISSFFVVWFRLLSAAPVYKSSTGVCLLTIIVTLNQQDLANIKTSYLILIELGGDTTSLQNDPNPSKFGLPYNDAEKLPLECFFLAFLGKFVL
jgi:hypothetical protein